MIKFRDLGSTALVNLALSQLLSDTIYPVLVDREIHVCLDSICAFNCKTASFWAFEYKYLNFSKYWKMFPVTINTVKYCYSLNIEGLELSEGSCS